MTNTIEVTLKISVGSEVEGFLDENSVKGVINQAMRNIADNVEMFCVVGEYEENPGSICVEVTALKENGEQMDLNLYGTEEVPWGSD